MDDVVLLSMAAFLAGWIGVQYGVHWRWVANRLKAELAEARERADHEQKRADRAVDMLAYRNGGGQVSRAGTWETPDAPAADIDDEFYADEVGTPQDEDEGDDADQ